MPTRTPTPAPAPALTFARRPTRRLRLAAGWWLGLAACLAAPMAHADCTERQALPAEAAFHGRALAALVAALPAAPAGVTAVDSKPFDFKNPPAFREVLCEGSKPGDFSITVRRQYVRKHSEAERRYWSAQYDQLQTEMVALKRLTPEKLAEQQALFKQSNAAWQATRDAEKAGDKAAAQGHDARYRSLRNQANDMDTQHVASVKPQLDALDQRRVAIDLELQRVDITLGMNLPRLPAAGDGLVVGRHGAPSPGRSAGLVVHNLAWSASGGDGPLRQALVAALEKAGLQTWPGQPLPSVAASAAVAEAAKTAPFSVADLPASAGTGAATSAAPAAHRPGAVATPGAPAVTSSPATTAAPDPTAAATASTATPPAAAPSAPAKTADSLKKASDAVNRLRGLLGR